MHLRDAKNAFLDALLKLWRGQPISLGEKMATKWLHEQGHIKDDVALKIAESK